MHLATHGRNHTRKLAVYLATERAAWLTNYCGKSRSIGSALTHKSDAAADQSLAQPGHPPPNSADRS